MDKDTEGTASHRLIIIPEKSYFHLKCQRSDSITLIIIPKILFPCWMSETRMKYVQPKLYYIFVAWVQDGILLDVVSDQGLIAPFLMMRTSLVRTGILVLVPDLILTGLPHPHSLPQMRRRSLHPPHSLKVEHAHSPIILSCCGLFSNCKMFFWYYDVLQVSASLTVNFVNCEWWM